MILQHVVYLKNRSVADPFTTSQGVSTPRWRKIEQAARKAKGAAVDFHSVVETRAFQDGQVGNCV